MAVRVYGGASTVGGGSANDPQYIVGTVGFVRGGGGATLDASGNVTNREDGVFDVTGYTSNDDIAEARTQRDAWFNNHAEILEEYRTGPALLIELRYIDSGGDEAVTYERYRTSTSSWVTVTGVLEGTQGDQGFQGLYEIRVYRNTTDTSSVPAVPNDGTYDPATKTWTTEPTDWSATPTQPGNDEVTWAAHALIDPADTAQQTAFTPTFDFVAQFSSHFLTPHEMAEAVSNDIISSGTGVPDDANADDEISQLYFRIRSGQATEIYRSADGEDTWTQISFGGVTGGGVDHVEFYTFYKRNFQIPDVTDVYDTSGTIGTDAHLDPDTTNRWYDTVAAMDTARPQDANEPLWVVDIVSINYASYIATSDAKPIGHNPHALYRGAQDFTDITMDLIPEEEEIDGDESFLIEGNTDLLELIDTTGNEITLRPTGNITELSIQMTALQTPVVVRYHNPSSSSQTRNEFAVSVYLNGSSLGSIFSSSTEVQLDGDSSGTVHYSSGFNTVTITQDLDDSDRITIEWASSHNAGTDDEEFGVQYEGEPIEIGFEITGTHPGGRFLDTDDDGDIVAVEANGDENKLFTRGGRLVGEGERDVERKIEEALAETLQLDNDTFLIWTRSAGVPTAETGTYNLDTKEYTLPTDWAYHIDELSGTNPLYFNTIRITKAGRTTTGVDAGTPQGFGTGGGGSGISDYISGDSVQAGDYIRYDDFVWYVESDDDGSNGNPPDLPAVFTPAIAAMLKSPAYPDSEAYDSSNFDVDSPQSSDPVTFVEPALSAWNYDADTDEYILTDATAEIEMNARSRSGVEIQIRNDAQDDTTIGAVGGQAGYRMWKNRGRHNEEHFDFFRLSSAGLTQNIRGRTSFNFSNTFQFESRSGSLTFNRGDRLSFSLIPLPLSTLEYRTLRNGDFDGTASGHPGAHAESFQYDPTNRQFVVTDSSDNAHGLFTPGGQAVGSLKEWIDERDYIPRAFYVDSATPDEQYDADDFTWDEANSEWDTPSGVTADRPDTVQHSLHLVFLFHTDEDVPIAKVVLPTVPFFSDDSVTVEEQYSQGYSSAGTWADHLGPDSKFFRLVINGVATRAFRLANVAVEAAEALVSEQVDETHDGAYLSFDHYRHWEDGIRWHSLPPEVSVNADNEIVCHANSVTLTFEPIETAHRYFLMFNHGDTQYTQTETVVRFERLNGDGSLDTAINIAEQTDDSFVIGRNSERTLDMELSSGPPTILLSNGQRGRITILSTPGPEGADDGIKIEGGVFQARFDVDIAGAAYELDIDEDYLNYRDANVPDTHQNSRRRIIDFATGRILISTTPPRLIYGGYNRDNRRGPYHTLNANGKVTWDHNVLENHFGGDESIVTFFDNTDVPRYVDPTPGAVNSVHVANQVFQLAPNTYDIEIRGGIRSHGSTDHMQAYLRKAAFGDFGLTTHIYEDFAFAGDRFLAVANSNDEIRGWTDEGARHSAYDINITTAGDRWRAVCYSAERDRIFAIAEEDNSSNNDLQARAWELDGTRQSSDDSGDLSSGISDGVKAMDALGTRIVVLDADSQDGALRLYHSTWDRASSLDVTLPTLTSPATYEGVCFASDGTGYWVLSTDKLEYFSLGGTEDGDREIDLSGISSFDPAGVALDTENDRLFILDDNANTAYAYDEATGRRIEEDEIIDETFIVTNGSNNGQFVLVARSLELSRAESFYVDFEDYDTSNRPTLGHYMLIENLTA